FPGADHWLWQHHRESGGHAAGSPADHQRSAIVADRQCHGRAWPERRHRDDDRYSAGHDRHGQEQLTVANTIVLSEPTATALMAVWTGLQLEKGVSSTNLASFAIVVQIPYVAGQTTYTYIDNVGAVTDWYRVVRYGPSGLGTYSPPWPVTPP